LPSLEISFISLEFLSFIYSSWIYTKTDLDRNCFGRTYNYIQVKVQRTLKWVLSHQDGEDNADLSRLPPTDNIGSVRLGPADHISSIQHASADNMVPTRLGSIDNLSSTRTGSTDNLSGSLDVRWKRSSGPVTGIRIGENLNINQGKFELLF